MTGALLSVALSAHWAMEESSLFQLFDIISRENSSLSPQALEAYRAKSLERAERATVRDGVAVLDAFGPLVKRANLFDAISGATSYEILHRDLQAALDDRDISAILVNADTPGGMANGVGELAAAIYAARGRKPIYAYVGGVAASAGYWLAAAAEKIIIAPTAILGSIGVQVALVDRRAAEEKAGIRRLNFVSSQSPEKNADPATEPGAAALQRTVDALAQVFVNSVATYRGVTAETVLTRFGRGGTEVGKAAIDAGLADEIGTFESALIAVTAKARNPIPIAAPRAALPAPRVFAAMPTVPALASASSLAELLARNGAGAVLARSAPPLASAVPARASAAAPPTDAEISAFWQEAFSPKARAGSGDPAIDAVIESIRTAGLSVVAAEPDAEVAAAVSAIAVAGKHSESDLEVAALVASIMAAGRR